MKPTDTKRPVKTAGYSFAKQSARRAKRRARAEWRAANLRPFESKRGLREKISYATSEDEIKGHLANGIIRFTGASDKTRRQWSATAQRRTVELTRV